MFLPLSPWVNSVSPQPSSPIAIEWDCCDWRQNCMLCGASESFYATSFNSRMQAVEIYRGRLTYEERSFPVTPFPNSQAACTSAKDNMHTPQSFWGEKQHELHQSPPLNYIFTGCHHIFFYKSEKESCNYMWCVVPPREQGTFCFDYWLSLGWTFCRTCKKHGSCKREPVFSLAYSIFTQPSTVLHASILLDVWKKMRIKFRFSDCAEMCHFGTFLTTSGTAHKSLMMYFRLEFEIVEKHLGQNKHGNIDLGRKPGKACWKIWWAWVEALVWIQADFKKS